jgi:4-amino-4-deoxy-L-arabinose transferase-like glycosyltransferase
MALGLALRVGVALAVNDQLQARFDELVYLRGAAGLRQTGELETGALLRPPLYFVFLAASTWAAQWLGVGTRVLAALVQCVAGAATAVPVYASTLRIGGRRAARLAVALLMLDPTLVAYCHLLWPETIFTLLVALVFQGVADLDTRPAGQAVLMGLLTGLALLLKPVFGVFTLLLALHWLRSLGWRRTLRLVLVFGGVAALVITPWVVRNQLRYGPQVLLENEGPYNLWIANDPRPAPEIHAQWRALPDVTTRSRVGTERGLAAIADDPAGLLRRGAVRMLNLWGLEFFVVRYAISGGYGPIDRASLLALFWLIQLGWVVLLLSAAAGVPAASRDPTFRLLLGYAALFTLLISVLVATTRFRVPFALPLAVAAGVGVDRALRADWGRREWLALATALLLLVLSAARPLFSTLALGDWTQVTELRRDDWRFFRY